MTEEAISKRRGVNGGFTRVEVVVVIASIVLLMSILMPALASVKTQTQDEIKCKANLRQVGITIFMYLQDEDLTMPNCYVIDYGSGSNGYFWTADGLESSPRLGPDDRQSYWGTAYNKYVKDINIFRCPAMREFIDAAGLGSLYGYPNEVFEPASFGLNGYIDRLETTSVANQAEVIICTDHVEPRTEQANQAWSGDMFCVGANDVNLSHYRGGSRGPWYRGIFRHNIRSAADYKTGGRASVLWLDGHVGAIEETAGENIPNRYYDPRGRWLNISR